MADLNAYEEWSNDLASILPEDTESWPGVNPDAAQEAIIEQALRHLVARDADLTKLHAALVPLTGAGDYLADLAKRIDNGVGMSSTQAMRKIADDLRTLILSLDHEETE